MKKQLLLGSALLITISAFPQNGKLVKPKPSGIYNAEIIAKLKYSEETSSTSKNASVQSAETPPELNVASKTAAINTWQKISGSMNILNSTISFGNPLQYNDQLNAVTFIHRKSATYSATPTPAAAAAGGVIVGMVTTNWGTSWDSTVLWSNDNEWGRYPQGGLFNPPLNTNINNAYIIGQGPTTGAATGWLGNYYASRKIGAGTYTNAISTVTNEMQWFSKSGPYPTGLDRHDFAAYCFTSTDDGKVRSIGGVTDESVTADSAIMIVTGSFNAGVFNWTGTRINPPTLIGSDGTDEFTSRPMMAWNEAGTVGYAAVIGSRSGATGSNIGYQPLVYKTTNSGVSWSLLPAIDFNSPANADVKRSLATAGTSTVEIPFFNWVEGMDMAVDSLNRVHIFSSIMSTASDHLDSLTYYSVFTNVDGQKYKWPHSPGYRPYLYDFIGDGTSAWTHITVDSMATEGPAGVTTGQGFQYNPWDLDASGNKCRIDARLQLSRTPNGKHIIYTWAESDTNFTDLANGSPIKWNNIPNIKARCYIVPSASLHPMEINITKPALGGNPNITNRAMYHFASATTGTNSASVDQPRIIMPVTVTNGNPYVQTAPFHWYMSADLNFGAVGIEENSANSAANSNVYPNPASNNATLAIELKDNSNVDVTVMNALGQSVKATKANAQTGSNKINIDLNGLSSGIYMVNVKVGNATSTKKLIVQ